MGECTASALRMVSLCYVCHEPTSETCQCECRAVVHAACLLKCVHKSGSPTCSICKNAIANLRARTYRRLSRFVGCFVATLFIVILTSCLAAMLLVALAAEEQRTREFYDLIVSCAVMVLISTIASSLLQKLLRERDLVEEHVEYKYV